MMIKQLRAGVIFACIVVSSISFTHVVRGQPAGDISFLTWSNDGTKIAIATSIGLIKVYDATFGTPLFEFESHVGRVTALSWSPDDSKLVTASPEDKTLRIWNMSTGAMIHEFSSDPYNEGIVFASWNPTTSILASVGSSTDGGLFLHMWSVDDDAITALPHSYYLSTYDMKWSPDGSNFAVADLRGLFIFDDFSTPELNPNIISLSGFTVAWSPDGTRLAARELYGDAINIVDISNGDVLMTIQDSINTSEHGASSLAWMPDGIAIIADSFDGRVRVWDATTGQLLETHSLDREGGRFLMSFSPYGGRLALGNAAPMPPNSSDSRQAAFAGALQFVVPLATIERLNAIAQSCISPDEQRGVTFANDEAQLADFVAQLEALTDEQIPPGCRADLLAVAEAIKQGR